jgi:hypothetical protein
VKKEINSFTEVGKDGIYLKYKHNRRFANMDNASLNRLINDFSLLPLDEKEYAVDIIEKQLIEAKREALAKRARKAISNFRKGAVKKGTVKELHKDLEID